MRLEGIVLHGALDWRRSVSTCGAEPSGNDGPIEIGRLVGGLANRRNLVKKIPSPRGTPGPAINSYQLVQYFRESTRFCREHRLTIYKKGRAAEATPLVWAIRFGLPGASMNFANCRFTRTTFAPRSFISRKSRSIFSQPSDPASFQ